MLTEPVRVWSVALADGTVLGTVNARWHEEATGAACVLAGRTNHAAQRLVVTLAADCEPSFVLVRWSMKGGLYTVRSPCRSCGTVHR